MQQINRMQRMRPNCHYNKTEYMKNDQGNLYTNKNLIKRFNLKNFDFVI